MSGPTHIQHSAGMAGGRPVSTTGSRPSSRSSFQIAGARSVLGSVGARRDGARPRGVFLSTASPVVSGTPELVLLSGPAVSGKSTVAENLLRSFPGRFGSPVAHTTRSPLPGERDGVDYHFVAREQLGRDITAGRFLVYVDLEGDLYGTSTGAVEAVLARGQSCLLDIDLSGAEVVRRSVLCSRTKFVFIGPGLASCGQGSLESKARSSGQWDIVLPESDFEVMALDVGRFLGFGSPSHAPVDSPPPPSPAPGGARESVAASRPKSTVLSRAAAFGQMSPGSTGVGTLPQQQHSGRELQRWAADPVEAAAVCRSRAGSVLGRQSVLRADSTPLSESPELRPPTAATLQRIDSLPIYGCEQLTRAGLLEVLAHVRSGEVGTGPKFPARRVLWVSAREDPTLFVNGRCVSLIREREEPTPARFATFEASEEVLRAELEAEAAAHGGAVLLHSELARGSRDGDLASAVAMHASWETLQEAPLTLQDAFATVGRSFPELRLVRLPGTEGDGSLQEQAFDRAIEVLKHAEPDWAIVFSCGTGCGRTTSLMAIAALLWPYVESGRSVREEHIAPASFRGSEEKPAILALISRLENGEAVRAWVDHCLSQCGHLQHLAEAMYAEKDAQSAALCTQQYLYFLLFAAYLQTQGLRPLASFATTFQEWMQHAHRTLRAYDILESAAGAARVALPLP